MLLAKLVAVTKSVSTGGGTRNQLLSSTDSVWRSNF